MKWPDDGIKIISLLALGAVALLFILFISEATTAGDIVTATATGGDLKAKQTVYPAKNAVVEIQVRTVKPVLGVGSTNHTYLRFYDKPGHENLSLQLNIDSFMTTGTINRNFTISVKDMPQFMTINWVRCWGEVEECELLDMITVYGSSDKWEQIKPYYVWLSGKDRLDTCGGEQWKADMRRALS